MKTRQILLAAAILVAFSACKNKPGVTKGTETTAPVQTVENQTTEAYTFHKYGIKSGIVTFETSMVGMKIKSVLYFDDYGAKEADEKYTGENVQSISICDGKERYDLKPSQKIAYSGGTCGYGRGIAYRFAWDEVSKEDQETKGKILANMAVAGKDCEAFSIDLGSSFTVYAGWKNICLYLKTTSQVGDVVMQAVKIEENLDIPAGKFQVPDGYEIKKSAF
jgi:hypothetical protein